MTNHCILNRISLSILLNADEQTGAKMRRVPALHKFVRPVSEVIGHRTHGLVVVHITRIWNNNQHIRCDSANMLSFRSP